MIINKHLKTHKPKINSTEFKSTILTQGSIGLKVLEKGPIALNQYNAIKHFFRRFLKKNKGRLWYRIFPEIFITKKSLGNARMGKGKGSVDTMILYVKKGQIILEINLKNNYNVKEAYKLLKQCQNKLSLRSKIFYLKK